MENVFDALCAVLAEPENKQAFLEEEGGKSKHFVLTLLKVTDLKLLHPFSRTNGANNERKDARSIAIHQGFGLRDVWFNGHS